MEETLKHTKLTLKFRFVAKRAWLLRDALTGKMVAVLKDNVTLERWLRRKGYQESLGHTSHDYELASA